eukprot:2294352-Pyramimonas_sp.AAC.1
MVDIVRPLSEPHVIPPSAYRKYPFLKPDSFTLPSGQPFPRMDASGAVSRYKRLLFLLMLLALAAGRTARSRRRGAIARGSLRTSRGATWYTTLWGLA